MRSCTLLLDDGLQSAARCVSWALHCEVTVVDSEPAWSHQDRRMVQIDMPDFLYRILEEFSSLSGASVESLLRTWIEEHAGESVSEEGRRIQERCRLITEWLDLGFAGKQPDLKYFAQRLASAHPASRQPPPTGSM